MEVTESFVLNSILLFLWIEYLWECYISVRQLKIYQTITKPPPELTHILNNEAFEKARLYGKDKIIFKLIVDLYEIIIRTFALKFKWIALAWNYSERISSNFGYTPDYEILISVIFIVFVSTVNYFMTLHFTLYKTFGLEEKHGFNKQTVGFFIKDQIKGYLVSQVLTCPLVAAAIYIIKLGGDMFVVWLWLFTTVATLILITIYPAVIAPLFDKFIPLQEGGLREGIEKLASSLKFPLSQIYVVEGSKRSAHSNAYFAGMFGVKRIVLFDTLIESYSEEKKTTIGCTEKEILGVIAHELGHWSRNHINRLLIITEINLLLLFLAFGFLFKFSLLYTSLGFPAGQEPIIIGLYVVLNLILAPYNAILQYLMMILSRKFEYEADNFAIDLNFGPELKSSLIKLGKDNLDYPVYDKLYSSWYHNHPTLLERIENINIKLNKKD